jgi:hypothetical protein
MSSARLGFLAIVLAAALAVVSPASGQEAAPLVNCGGGVRAAVVDCGKARRIAREYARTGHKSIWSYSCSSGEKRGRCVLDRKIVVFPVD